MFDGLLDAVVSDVVGRGLGAQVEMIADVLFDKALAVVAADDRVGQLDVFDDGLQLAAILLGHLASKDGGDLVGLADGAVGIQQTFAESIQSGATMEDEVVAVLHLSKKQAMLAAGLSALLVGEERREGANHFCAQVNRSGWSGNRPAPAGAPDPYSSGRHCNTAEMDSFCGRRLASQ